MARCVLPDPNRCHQQNSSYVSKRSVMVWPWLATKDQAVSLSPLSPVGWGGEWEEKGKTPGSG